MVKTHLPQHMDSVRERMRPKHQLLILKCYPRLPKNSTADVSPNGSELSYLLYYASTRRSKLHKVGAFLEKKTINDVYRSQSARVLVTLQILTALLENKVIGSDSGFGLIAPYVLRIIHSILTTSNDVGLIDACLETWQVFCRHQDQSTLAADHEYRALYEQTVHQWALYAYRNGAKRLGKSSTPVSVPDGIRLRTAGLGAIKALLVSDNLSSELGRQLNHGIPAILTNIHGGDASFDLTHLLTLSKRHEGQEKEKDRARRQSLATERTFNPRGSVMSDPRAAEGTTQDADAYAEEETAVFAIDCLKKVFDTDNRAQIRAGTSQVLDFVVREQGRLMSSDKATTAMDWTSWSAKLLETITAWTPVQDRFIILVTATETLVRLPLNDNSITQHLLMTQLIDDILRSDLNLIGLSVIDVLLLFIQQILRVLQLGTPTTAATEAGPTITNLERQSKKLSPFSQSMQHVLLARLKSCISDLATHVYYTDQIADMIATILLRLKPNATATSPPNPATTAAAIQEPTSAVTGSMSMTSLSRERSQSTSLPGAFFTFDSARQIALESVKEIIIVANTSRSQSSAGMAQSRNLVSLTVWEGTQWLLRDPAANVRRAYVDALCTWLQLETRKTDARIREPQPKDKHGDNTAAARRALSDASSKERQARKARTTFLQLLHLAVYENALQHAANSEADILLLHLLLVSMSPRLGVNAVQSALPMLLTLQEDIARVTSPVGKVRIGSLVHGYLWQLVEQFELNGEDVGREIFLEITRRKQHGLWMYAIGVPPTPLDRIPLSGSLGSTVPKISTEGLHHETLRPFDNRADLVSGIAESYLTSSIAAAPTSPSSPGRLTGPILDRHASSYLTAKQVMSTQLPQSIRESMLSIWSKETCIAAMTAAAPRETSVTGSRASPPHHLAGNHRQLLAAPGAGSSPRSEAERYNLRTGSNSSLHQNQASYQNNGQISRGVDRKPSYSTFGASGNGRSTVKVDELKQVLSGSANPVALVGRYDAEDDTGSESMVDVGGDDVSDVGSHVPSERGSMLYNARLAVTGSSVRAGKAPITNDSLLPVRASSIMSSGRASVRSSRFIRQDMSALLDGIDLGGADTKKYGGGVPPY